jgi:hypothetical protein
MAEIRWEKAYNLMFCVVNGKDRYGVPQTTDGKWRIVNQFESNFTLGQPFTWAYATPKQFDNFESAKQFVENEINGLN